MRGKRRSLSLGQFAIQQRAQMFMKIFATHEL
jgi:hypothetical protein